MIERVDLIIWGRPFKLPVEYNCYEGETVYDEQIEAVKHFMVHSEWLDKAKNLVKHYLKQQVESDTVANNTECLLSYITPECIFVKHEQKNPRVALMCSYKHDNEHGLAVVFSSDEDITVGQEDLIL